MFEPILQAWPEISVAWRIGLEHVQNEMVSPVIPARTGIVIVPTPVVHGNLHLRWIAVVQAIAALIVFAATEILWIVDIGVVVETRAIAATSGSPPSLSKGHCLRRLCISH